MDASELVTFDEWRHQHPEKWAQAEGTITRRELRNLKYLDAQIHLTREREHGTPPPSTPEVLWLRSCVALYLYVLAHGLFPKDEQRVTWVKNQRRGSLCDYQVASLMQIPGWDWRPSRTHWDQRASDLNTFRERYGREPRIRSLWDQERALAHWYARQRTAASNGKLTPNQHAILEGQTGQPTGELILLPVGSLGNYETWFQRFWAQLQVGA